jgi:hypothetical protein
MKTEYSCTDERFASDTSRHVMTVLRNEGVNRHLRFRRPGDSSYWFDIVTWDGRLCVDGDMGTYVFAREADMFKFFRSSVERINPSYWAEKVLSVAKGAGVEEWSEASFRRAVVQDVRDYFRESGNWADARACFKAVRRDVLRHSGSEMEAVPAILDFSHGSFAFQDFGEHRLVEYTFHYIWCCRAIVCAIEQFDKAAAIVTETA